jgi:Protein of unknown function (DUF3006)
MRVQIDTFEDNGWAGLLLYPDDKRGLEVPRELLSAGVSRGDVFGAGFEQDRAGTEQLASENWRLLEELVRRDEG